MRPHNNTDPFYYVQYSLNSGAWIQCATPGNIGNFDIERTDGLSQSLVFRTYNTRSGSVSSSCQTRSITITFDL